MFVASYAAVAATVATVVVPEDTLTIAAPGIAFPFASEATTDTGAPTLVLPAAVVKPSVDVGAKPPTEASGTFVFQLFHRCTT